MPDKLKAFLGTLLITLSLSLGSQVLASPGAYAEHVPTVQLYRRGPIGFEPPVSSDLKAPALSSVLYRRSLEGTIETDLKQGVHAREQLYAMLELAQSEDRPTLAAAALERLSLLEPDNLNHELDLLSLYLKYGYPEDQTTAQKKRICALFPDEGCQKAELLISCQQGEHKLILDQIRTLADSSQGNMQEQYRQALAQAEAIMPISQLDDDLKLAAASLLVRLPEREAQGRLLLEELAAKQDHFRIASKAQALLKNYALDRLYAKADRTLYDKNTRSVGIAAAQEALKLESDPEKIAALRRNLNEALYYEKLSYAEDLAAHGRIKAAQQSYHEALSLAPSKGEAYLELAGFYYGAQNFAQAKIAYEKALTLPLSAPERAHAISRLKAIKLEPLLKAAAQAQTAGDKLEEQKLLSKILSLDPKQIWQRYRLSRLLIEEGRNEEALRLFDKEDLKKAEAAYPYALLLSSLDRSQEALAVLSQVKKPNDNTRELAAELKLEQALSQVQNRLDNLLSSKEGRTASHKIELKGTLEEFTALELSPALKLKAASGYAALGDLDKALALCKEAKAIDPKLRFEADLLAADLLSTHPEYHEASSALAALDASFKKAVSQDSLSRAELLSLSELYAARGNFAEEKALLTKISGKLAEQNTLLPRQENAVLAIEAEFAAPTLQAEHQALPADDFNAPLFYRNYARSLFADGKAEAALSEIKKGLTILGVSASDEDDYAFTSRLKSPYLVYSPTTAWLTDWAGSDKSYLLQNISADRKALPPFYTQEELTDCEQKIINTPIKELTGYVHPYENYLVSSSRREAITYFKADNPIFALGTAYARDRGTKGYSDFTSLVTMAELSLPTAYGTFKLRADEVYLDAGSLARAPYESKFGTIYEEGFSQGSTLSSDHGTALAVRFENEHFYADLGTTPLGFLYEELTFSFGLNLKAGEVSLTPELYRRPQDSSLLAYGGQIDPGTGKRFGAVMREGLSLNLSWDQGLEYGIWAQAAAERLRGHRTADNQSFKLMAGFYQRLINRSHQELRAGITAMYWHFDKDLSDYTLGQGGYFSPQSYASAGPNLTLRLRGDSWTISAEGTLSYSFSQSDSHERYPLKELIPESLPDKYVMEESDKSSGISGGMRLCAEKRISEHLVLGAELSYTQADGYTPFFAGLYFKLSFSAYGADLSLPPQPLIPVSKW